MPAVTNIGASWSRSPNADVGETTFGLPDDHEGTMSMSGTVDTN
jgi:hypothetical protein